jgi:hypothetical protein
MVRVAYDWTSAAGRWLAEFGWNELERDRFTQVDIDWFSDEAPRRPVPAALDCVWAALEAAQQRYRGIDGLVTVPLPYAEHPDAEVPDLADLLESDWAYGPGRHVVGLYVIAPALLEPVEGVEDIRVPYPTSELLPAPLTAYYRCVRDEGDGWVVYDRTVYIRTNTTN